MNKYPDAIANLISQLSALPGIGPKSAERLAFFLLRQNNQTTDSLINALTNLRKNSTWCDRCFNISTANPCAICTDAKRDQQTVCIVAEPQDVQVIEKTGDYHGVYHVLGGVLNPVEGITPDQLRIKELLQRIQRAAPPITEVIIATNPDLEGESTAMYIARQLKEQPLKITRLAKGLPMGADLEYADEITVSSAIKGRQEMK